jgi:hypothetical protein
MNKPIYANWNGEVFIPLEQSISQCNDQFTVGQNYRLIEQEERSRISHDHYFANIHDMWQTMPEGIAKHFQSDEHLRKWSLIRTGYCISNDFVFETPNDAKIAATLLAKRYQYAVIRVSGSTITITEAESQSRRNMDAKRFQESKNAVLNYIASLIPVKLDQLQQEAIHDR